MFDAMHLFLRTVQLGSMSAAAKDADVSTASVSRRIRALEEHLHVQLLNRNSRSLVLTEAGEAHYEELKRIAEQLRTLQDSTLDIQNQPQGLLRVHANTSVGVQLIAAKLKDFHTAYPKIEIDLQMSERSINLLEEKFDIDIRLGELKDSSLLVRKLAPSDRMLVASPQYLASHPPIVTPVDLLAHNCLTYRPEGGTTTWRFRHQGAEDQEVKIRGSLHSNNGETLRQMALAGLGIVLVTDWGTWQARQDGRLIEVLPDYHVTLNSFSNGIYAVFRQTRYVPKKVRVFIDFLAERFQSEPAFAETNAQGRL